MLKEKIIHWVKDTILRLIACICIFFLGLFFMALIIR